MHQVFLGLGSNLGNRSENLQNAIYALGSKARVIKCSPVYETPPWGYEEQPKFLNQVIQISTELEPGELLRFVKDIEQAVGREKTFRYGPRVIDIDILFINSLMVNSPPLIVPHAQVAERAFVLVPLADIAPDFIHPVLGQSIKRLLSNLDHDEIELFAPGDCSELDK